MLFNSFPLTHIFHPSALPTTPTSRRQRPLGRRNLPLLAGNPARRLPNRNRQRLERALRPVVIILPPETVNVQRDPRRLRKALQAVRQHLAAQVANLLAPQAEVDDAKGAVRQVDHRPGQGLVEGRVGGAEAGQARGDAEGGGEGAAEGDAAVFGRVVVVDWDGRG